MVMVGEKKGEEMRCPKHFNFWGATKLNQTSLRAYDDERRVKTPCVDKARSTNAGNGLQIDNGVMPLRCDGQTMKITQYLGIINMSKQYST